MTAIDDCPPDLVRVDPAEPGLTRRRRGRGFSYLDAEGAPITNPAEVARLKALVIPPAWQDVWICPDEHGHIQALGTDAAGRRQYRYHEDWRKARDVVKHDRVLALGAEMPQVRAEVVRRLDVPGLGRERVLAAAVRMLDIGVFRAGGEQYAPGDDDDDGTFGLATLRREHVSLKRGAVLFDYPAKHKIERVLALRDPLLHKVIGSLLRRNDENEELLGYRVGKVWHDVKTSDLNLAVKEVAGDQHTCKDLRTWNATVLAAVAVAAGVGQSGQPSTQRARKRLATGAVKQVSEHLGNTPTVARSSYIDPRIWERLEQGKTVLGTLRDLDDGCNPDLTGDANRAVVEEAVVKLLRTG